mgnify:CR=1 FL=1
MNNSRSKTILRGLELIAIAACLILWKLNLFNLPPAFAGVSTWGLIIAAFMVLIIIHSIIDLSFGGILFPIAIICIIFDNPLGITAITPWIVLIAALLVTIALNMIFPKHEKKAKYSHDESGYFANKKYENSTEDQNGHVSYAMKFGSATKYVRIPNLTSADLNSQFGELSVFFDGSQVPGGRVFINCNVSFGEMDLYIPASWRVENKVSVALGDCKDHSSNAPVSEGGIICVIDGSVSFGELKVIRV